MRLNFLQSHAVLVGAICLFFAADASAQTPGGSVESAVSEAKAESRAASVERERVRVRSDAQSMAAESHGRALVAASEIAASAPRRKLPSYDPTEEKAAPGAARRLEKEPGIEPEDIILAIPRAVLFVPKLALELVFWPVSKGLYLVDKYAVIEHVRDVLYNDERTAGVLPTGQFSTSRGLMVGAVAFHDDLFGSNESISASAQYGSRSQQNYELDFYASHLLHTALWLDVSAEFSAEPSIYFGGIGIQNEVGLDPTRPRVGARESNQLTVYSSDEWRALIGAGHTFGRKARRVRTGFYSVFETNEFSASSRQGTLTSIDEPALESIYDPSSIPGFVDGTTTLAFFWVLEADFRTSKGLRQTGTFFELYAGGNPGITDWSYVHIGSELSHTIALFNQTRLLHLRASYEGIEGDAPFSTLAQLGGSHRLRGYVEGRFRDNHSALGSVQYLYPIHKNVSGSLFVDAGYVAEEIDDLATFEDWKLGGGGGFLVGSPESISLRLQVAYGEALEVFVGTDLARSLDGFLERP